LCPLCYFVTIHPPASPFHAPKTPQVTLIYFDRPIRSPTSPFLHSFLSGFSNPPSLPEEALSAARLALAGKEAG
jgi:hypothetical protein